eukprot:9471533-Alexandrium_andersonii.AAC.1
MERGGGRAGGPSRGVRWADPPREALCYAGGNRWNRIDRRSRARRGLLRAGRGGSSARKRAEPQQRG